MSGRRPLSRRLRRRRAQVSHQASRPKRPPILSSAPPTSLPSSTSRRVVHVLGPLLPFFFGAFSRLWVARRTLENAPDLSVLAPRRSRPARPSPRPPRPRRCERSYLEGTRSFFETFSGTRGKGPCAPWMRAKFVPTLWGMGGFQSNHHATLREGGRSEEERGWWGGGRRKEEKQAGTLQLHKHAKEKKKRYAAKFYSRRRGCSCRATNFAGVEE